MLWCRVIVAAVALAGAAESMGYGTHTGMGCRKHGDLTDRREPGFLPAQTGL